MKSAPEAGGGAAEPMPFDIGALLTFNVMVALALGAVLAFWMIGAYNRLMALRNALKQSWARVDETLRQRGDAGGALLAALRAPLAAEHGALAAWQAALAAATAAAATMTARPLVAEHAAAWVAAESALAAAASRVFALLDQHADLRMQEPVAGQAAAWRDAGARLAFARQVFNDAAGVYNAAVALFPTRLLVRLFGFWPAGKI